MKHFSYLLRGVTPIRLATLQLLFFISCSYVLLLICTRVILFIILLYSSIRVKSLLTFRLHICHLFLLLIEVFRCSCKFWFPWTLIIWIFYMFLWGIIYLAGYRVIDCWGSILWTSVTSVAKSFLCYTVVKKWRSPVISDKSTTLRKL